MDNDNNGTPAEEEPLLVADQAAVWDDIEVAANGAESITVQQLISQVSFRPRPATVTALTLHCIW